MKDVWSLFYEGIKCEQNVKFELNEPFLDLLSSFLQEKLPEKFALGQGQVFSLDGDAADDSDLILYDRQHTPRLLVGRRQLVPAETAGVTMQTLEVLTAQLLREEARQIRQVRRLQKLTRKSFTGGLDLMSTHPHTLGVIVARTAEISLEEIAQVLEEEQSAWPETERVSAVFVVGVGVVIYRTEQTGELRFFPLADSKLTTIASGEDTIAFLLLFLCSYLNSIEIIPPNLMPLMSYANFQA